MKVFISYSTGDLGLVNQLARFIELDAEVFYWNKDKQPGEEAWDTIFQWIDQSDLVVTVLTDKTVSRAMSVGQEIGHAKAKGKTIVPLVGPNVPVSELGCLKGVTYIKLNRDKPKDILDELEQVILDKKQKIAKQQILSLVGLSALAILALLASD